MIHRERGPTPTRFLSRRFVAACVALSASLSACSGGDPTRSEMANTTAIQDAGAFADPAADVGTVAVAPSNRSDAATARVTPTTPAQATPGQNAPGSTIPGQTTGTPATIIDSGAPPPDAQGQSQASIPELQPMRIGKPTLLAKNFILAESPTWDPCGKRLIVADPSNNTISEVAEDGQVSVLLSDTDYTNGMIYDRDGSLLMAQMGNNMGGRVARLDRSGSITVLVDKDPRGGRLHTVDDLTVRSDGTIYFSDGDFSHASHTTLILTPTPLYILKPGPNPRVLVAGPSVAGPNGVELSPDEKTLYLDAYFSNATMKYQVEPDGTLSAAATLASAMSNADSLCLDLAGNLYVGVAGGLQVLKPDGTRLKTIPVEFTNKVTNCTFGGPQGTTLFITAWTEVWKVDDMPIPGLDWSINQRIDCGPANPPAAPGAFPSFASLPPRRP